jgi:hypothetical protein
MYLPEKPEQPRKNHRKGKTDKKFNPHLPKDPIGKRYVQYFWHPYSAIIAPVPEKGEKPDWRTLNHYLQPSQLWTKHQNPEQLIGIRFGKTTRYAIIDIDKNSNYRNQEAIKRVKEALEGIGIVRTIIIQSSYSGGYHIVITFETEIETFGLACAIEQTLKKADIKIRPGQIEIFPNTKLYSQKTIINYNAVRCPMQPGSGAYILNEDLEAESKSIEKFLDECDLVAAGQDIEKIKREIKKAKEKQTKEKYRQSTSRKVEEWKKEWEEIIAQGWTSQGQTNTILQIMVGYGIVFQDQQGEELVKQVTEKAKNAPGYKEYCRHQQEIEKRVRHWVETTTRHKWYTPYCSHPERKLGTFANTYNQKETAEQKRKTGEKDNIIPFDRRAVANQQRSEQAQQRIKKIVEKLEKTAGLKQNVTERIDQIKAEHKKQYNRTISQQTLYKHQELWHPQKYIEDPWQKSSKEGEKSSNPCTERDYRQKEQKETERTKQKSQNLYTEKDYGQQFHMKVQLCLPSAPVPQGQGAVLAMNQNQACGEEQELNQQQENQKNQQDTNSSKNSSLNDNNVELILNTFSEELIKLNEFDNINNSVAISSSESLDLLEQVQTEDVLHLNLEENNQENLCVFYAAAEKNSHKQNLLLSENDRLGAVCTGEKPSEKVAHEEKRGDNEWEEGKKAENEETYQPPVVQGYERQERALISDVIPDVRVGIAPENSIYGKQADLGGMVRQPQEEDDTRPFANTQAGVESGFVEQPQGGSDSTGNQPKYAYEYTPEELAKVEECKRMIRLYLGAVSYVHEQLRRYRLFKGRFPSREEREYLEKVLKMQYYLDSGHELLVAEAEAWAAENPGCLPFTVDW